MLHQVQKTEDMTAEATAKANAVEKQARAVTTEAESVAEASEIQQQALEKAKASVRGVVAAGETAQAAFRYVASGTNIKETPRGDGLGDMKCLLFGAAASRYCW